MPYQTPETIVGIGGAGKSVVERFMNKKYILNELFRDPEEGPAGYNRQLSAFTIDTAADEYSSLTGSDGRPAAKEIQDRINEVADIRATVPGLFPTYDHINIVDEIHRQYSVAEGLVEESNVRDIAASEGLSCWWLREDPHMLTAGGQSDFGIERWRGLGKALLHASRVGEDPLQQVITDAKEGENCALVVGLGGGTGSGMFLDIGKELCWQGQRQVTLFAILPTLNEGRAEKANAYAALSELEWLAITDRNPFVNIILIPAEPASTWDEFGEAVVKTILSYYNIHNGHAQIGSSIPSDPTFPRMLLDESKGGNSPPMYAPFTIAVPQMLHYVASEDEANQEQSGYSHRKMVAAYEPEKIRESDNIADAQLWESPNEPELIQNRLVNEFVYDRLTDIAYTALQLPTIKYAAGQIGYEYDQHRLVSVLMSRAFEDTDSVETELLNSDRNIRGLRQTLTDSIYVPENCQQYFESIIPFGGKWDMSVVTFIGGIFLDNLSPIQYRQIGYKDAYEAEKESLGNNIIIRHTHGVDGNGRIENESDGNYIYRREVIDINSDEKEIFINTEINAKDKIKKEYQGIVGFKSTVELPK